MSIENDWITLNDVTYYTYNVEGIGLSMNSQGDEYFYVKNLGDDIIEMIDRLGGSFARYR
jgi:hypothetical protein